MKYMYIADSEVIDNIKMTMIPPEFKRSTFLSTSLYYPNFENEIKYEKTIAVCSEIINYLEYKNIEYKVTATAHAMSFVELNGEVESIPVHCGTSKITMSDFKSFCEFLHGGCYIVLHSARVTTSCEEETREFYLRWSFLFPPCLPETANIIEKNKYEER